MSMRSLLCSILLATALTCVGCAKKQDGPKPAPTPVSAVKSFYDWRIKSQLTGAPSPAQLATMTPYISSDLHELLAKARAQYEKDVARAPNDKPAFAEGDLFSSLFEGPTTFTTGEVESVDADNHVVPVRFVAAKQLPAVNWIDRVHVIRENGNYVVADVEYINHWDFGNKGTLTDALKRTNKKRARPK